MTLFADVVAASEGVAGTSSRSRKVAILAELLGRLEPAEVPIAVGFLAGVPRQGRVGSRATRRSTASRCRPRRSRR